MISWKRDVSGSASRSAAVARRRAGADRFIREILSGSTICGHHPAGSDPNGDLLLLKKSVSLNGTHRASAHQGKSDQKQGACCWPLMSVTYSLRPIAADIVLIEVAVALFAAEQAPR